MADKRLKMVTLLSTALPWLLPPATMILGRDEVHVWRASLDESPTRIDSFLNILAEDEQSRADRFYFRRDRERFIAAHGILRTILGRYLNRAPNSLSFYYGSYGKPELAGESGSDGIHFNLSHSDGVVLYALARGREIGIDVESIRDLEVEQIAGRFFSRQEIATLRALPPDLRNCAFFHCWTRKESYIKARGEGLSLPLDQFDVSLTPGEPAALLSTRPDSEEARRWDLQELAVASGYAAALAVEGHGWSLSCSQWPRGRREPPLQPVR
jgi:4'-phosphopantetheinyl transferase